MSSNLAPVRPTPLMPVTRRLYGWFKGALVKPWARSWVSVIGGWACAIGTVQSTAKNVIAAKAGRAMGAPRKRLAFIILATENCSYSGLVFATLSGRELALASSHHTY